MLLQIKKMLLQIKKYVAENKESLLQIKKQLLYLIFTLVPSLTLFKRSCENTRRWAPRFVLVVGRKAAKNQSIAQLVAFPYNS